MIQADPEQPHDDDTEAQFAAFMRRMSEHFAAREAADPTPPRPPEAWVDKPAALAAAEADLFRYEIVLRIQKALCADVARCKRGRCRRTKRCRELHELQPLLEATRAEVARQRAKWQPPAPAPEPAGKGKRAGARR